MLEFYLDEKEGTPELGKTKINKNMVDNCSNFTEIRSCRNNGFALSVDIPNPHYKTFTYFSYPDGTFSDEADEPESYIGSIIDGFCISDNSKDVYYIYDYELR